MKKLTIYLVLSFVFGLFQSHITATAAADDVDWSEIITILDKSHASGNMPEFINDPGATRGAGFNGEYVFVASRQGGSDNVYYWNVNDPDAGAGMLDLTGVSGGTFTLADMTVVGEHIFVSNMVFAGGQFKLYHWDGIDASPTTLIQYNTPVRLGDAFTVLGDPGDYAEIYVSAHGGSAFYIWAIDSGQLVSNDPIVVAEWDYGTNFARVSQVVGNETYGVASGPLFGPVLIDLFDGQLTETPLEFFPDWPMYANVFVVNNERYMVLMRVRGTDPSENVLYVLDLNEGESLEEAFELLGTSTFAEKIVHQVNIGDIPNGNASVSVDLVVGDDDNLYIFGFAAGNGFIVQMVELPEGEPDPDPDDPVEVSTLAELREKPADGTLYIYTGNAVIVAMDDFRNRKFIQDETAAILIDDNPGIITTDYMLYDVITNIEGKINIFHNMVRFQPTENTDPATENTSVDPYVFQFSDVTTGDQAKLVKFEQVFFENNGNTFENGQSYTITDGENTFVVRTDFFDADYIGDAIPANNVPVDITGVILQYQETLQIVPRFAADFVEYEVSIPSIQSISLNVYPNPASSMISVTSNQEISGLRMLDMLGKVIYTSNASGGQHEIDVSSYRNGLYFLQVFTPAGTFTERIQVAR